MEITLLLLYGLLKAKPKLCMNLVLKMGVVYSLILREEETFGGEEKGLWRKGQ